MGTLKESHRSCLDEFQESIGEQQRENDEVHDEFDPQNERKFQHQRNRNHNSTNNSYAVVIARGAIAREKWTLRSLPLDRFGVPIDTQGFARSVQSKGPS